MVSTSAIPSSPTLPALAPALALFFLSGVSALAYEIVWSRQLGLLMGHTVQASTAVLAAYFVGMSLGAVLGSRISDRVSRPLAAYGLLEIGIGAWALVILMLLSDAVATRVDWLLSAGPAVQSLVCLLILLPATVGLGATLPLIVTHVRMLTKEVACYSSLAYGLNTLGALAGVLAATFCLIALVGVSTTASLASALSIACGSVAILVSRSEGASANRASRELPDSRPREAMSIRWMAIAAGSGFISLFLQVLYLRLFALVFHNTTYTFGIVIAVYLLGLSLGAAATSWLSRRIKGARLVAVACLLAAGSVALSPAVFAWLSGMQNFSFGRSLFTHALGATGLAAGVLLPAVAALGIVLPASWQAAWEAKPAAAFSKIVGELTAINTWSAALGALAASFLFLPLLGLGGSIALAVVGLAALGVAAANSLRWETACAGLIVVGLALWAAWEPYRHALPKGAELVRRWEGPYGWTEILRRPFDGVQLLRQDVQYGLGADLDEDWERRQGYLPLLLHDDPQEVAFLGVGTGISVSSFVACPRVQRVDAVELIPEVVQALPYFSRSNLAFYDDPRCHLHVNDARHFMARTSRQYDVVVADLFTPWHSQTGYMYTVEHFRHCRQRLKPGGLYCQWLALWQLGAVEFEMIADSFREVYPQTTMWWGLIEPDKPLICLLGTDSPLELHESKIASRLSALASDPRASDPYLASLTRIAHLYVGAWPRRHNALLNTSDRPRIEFMAPATHVREGKLRGERAKRYFADVLSMLPQRGLTCRWEQRAPIALAERQRWQYWRLSVPVRRGQGAVPTPTFLDELQEAAS